MLRVVLNSPNCSWSLGGPISAKSYSEEFPRKKDRRINLPKVSVFHRKLRELLFSNNQTCLTGQVALGPKDSFHGTFDKSLS